MLAALILLTIVVLALLAVGVHDRAGHRRHLEHVLAAQDGERWSWARERWDLTTRLQSPDVVRFTPPPPPPAPVVPGAPPRAVAPEPFEDDLEPDESDFVGTIVRA